jgi:predicted nicotinamide N-methyase
LLQYLQHQLNLTLPAARIEVTDLPGCPDIRLGLINADFPGGPLEQETMRAVLEDPAYWAFCWGSGLALARFLLDDPIWVTGKRVVDLGSGSGVVAIAAAMAGAGKVVACDTDPDARMATAANASLNELAFEVTEVLPETCDLLLMADVLYDRQNLPLLATAQSHATEVLVADSRITDLPDRSYTEVARIEALTCPNLGEFDEFKTAHVFHWRASLSGTSPRSNRTRNRRQ